MLQFGEEDEVGGEEMEGESMLRLMQEIKNLREVNKCLTDEERRKNAEEMILKLSQYMDIDGGEEDDDFGEFEWICNKLYIYLFIFT